LHVRKNHGTLPHFLAQSYPTNGFISGHEIGTVTQLMLRLLPQQPSCDWLHTSTSASATTITLPTGTLLGAALGAVRGTTLDLYIDNTAGASTVTIAVATDGILSSAANDASPFALSTVAAGATGVGRFTIMFSSATAYVFTRMVN
jgi:hypothetical protein